MANTILNFHFDYWHPSLRYFESGWLSGNMDYVAVVVLATLCVSCDYCAACRPFVQVQILQFDHLHHCCCYLGCYAMYCSPCAFYDMAEDMEPGTGVSGPHQDSFWSGLGYLINLFFLCHYRHRRHILIICIQTSSLS